MPYTHGKRRTQPPAKIVKVVNLQNLDLRLSALEKDFGWACEAIGRMMQMQSKLYKIKLAEIRLKQRQKVIDRAKKKRRADAGRK